MVVLRDTPAKSVRFDNGVGLARDTNGRLVRGDRPPRSSPSASQRKKRRETEAAEAAAAAVVAAAVRATNEDEDEDDSTEDEEVAPPIATKLELRFILDGVKTAPAGKVMDMSCWLQPGNELRENVRFSIEMTDIKRRASDWVDSYVMERRELNGGTLREFSAIVSSRGSSKNPYHFNFDGGDDVESYKSMYEKIKQLHIDKAKDVRAIVSQYFKLQERTPSIDYSQSQPRSQTPLSQLRSNSQPRSSQKRPRAETATERQNRGRETAREAERLTGNYATEIYENWICHNKSCKNWGKSCYQFADGSHILLTSDDLTRWSEQVNSNDTVTVDKIPPSLRDSLLYRRAIEEGSRREKSGKKMKASNELDRLPISLIVNTYGGSQPPPTPVATELRSSPPIVLGHEFNNLHRYLEWLEEKGKIMPTARDIAGRGLEDYGYGYSALGDVLDDEWEKMGVKRGTKLQILKNRRPWAHQLAEEEIVRSQQLVTAQRRERERGQSPINISDADNDEEDENSDGYRTPAPLLG